MMFKKILVPLDGSKLAEQVFPYVAVLAQAFGPEIFLVGVCEPEETASGQGCRLYLRSEAELLQQQLGAGAPQIHQVTLEGHAAEKILEYAREQQMDVILASSHGRSGLNAWPLGSTVNRLLHEAIPLIVIKAAEKPLPAAELVSRILVPLDGSEVGDAVIAPLLHLSRKITTGITLLQVIEKEHHVRTIGGLDVVPYLDGNLETRQAEAQEYLEGVARQFDGTLAKVTTVVRLGQLADEIIKQANDMDASLIALASHVHSAVESWFYGSVTQKIVGAAGRSFLLVPSNHSEAI